MKCFIIYNPNDPLSSRLMKESVDSCKPYNINPVPFPGVFGKNVDIVIEQEKLKPSKLKEEYTQGDKGCFLSHYLLWRKCAEDQIPYLILEHDIHMVRGVPEDILDHFDELCNLDLCGSLRKEYDKYIECMNKTGIPKVKKLFNENLAAKDATWRRAKEKNVSGAHAYIIKQEGAKKLIDAAKTFGFLPTDVHINEFYVKINVCEPSIFRTCDFMIDKKNRVKYSSTKGYKIGQE